MNDEKLYSKCLEDFDSGIYEKDLYNKALVLSQGDKNKAKFKYVELWVKKEKTQNNLVKTSLDHNQNTPTTKRNYLKPNIEKTNLIIDQCTFLEENLIGTKTPSHTLKSNKLIDKILDKFGLNHKYLFAPLFFGWSLDSQTGLFQSKKIRDTCLNYFTKNYLFGETIEDLKDSYLKFLEQNPKNKEKFDSKIEDHHVGDRFLTGVVGIIFWCCTGGLMTVHVVSSFIGATSLFLGVIGFFIPPIGLINAFILIFTGYSLSQHF